MQKMFEALKKCSPLSSLSLLSFSISSLERTLQGERRQWKRDNGIRRNVRNLPHGALCSLAGSGPCFTVYSGSGTNPREGSQSHSTSAVRSPWDQEDGNKGGRRRRRRRRRWDFTKGGCTKFLQLQNSGKRRESVCSRGDATGKTSNAGSIHANERRPGETDPVLVTMKKLT